MPSKQNAMFDGITHCLQFFVYLFNHSAAPQRDDSWHIFNQYGFGFNGRHNTQKVLEEMVAFIVQCTYRCIDGKHLTRRATHNQIHLSIGYTKFAFQIRFTDFPNITDDDFRFWMIEFVGFG